MMNRKKILICNRGEIAIRVAKAIRELGHIAVGFWTDNEKEPAHLEYCDQWVHLKGNNNTDTYLNMDQIITIIQEHKIDAVHPGYGFLSENTVFSKKLEDLGVIFIGPHAEAIHKMGDKAISKQMAKEAGVPVVPGSTGEINSVAEAVEIAQKIGYPVLLKAVAGGGGKGMRTCKDAAELDKNFEAVRREAQSSFGNPGVLVEKFIVNPHHIEVQIIADNKGNIYHCYERECSVQRRHQKIIEEAPSPFIGTDDKLRREICETAVKLARAVNYNSAGTVEFIMGEDKSFYFLEMNTRIQVEHPITEEITGIDLVANMIKGALGESFDFQSQDEIRINGHAIECRICAEDPVTMLPAPGHINGFDTLFPQGARFDHCIFSGLDVKPDFDPMIGKLIVHGHNRSVVIRKMCCALDGLYIEGLKTNIPLQKIIMREDNFVGGHYTTNYIYEVMPQNSVAALVSLERLYEKAIAIELKSLQ
jgi:acetyl/propionyl-CoA carboxylase alpha subunit